MIFDYVFYFTFSFSFHIFIYSLGPQESNRGTIQGVKKVPDPKQNYIGLMTEG